MMKKILMSSMAIFMAFVMTACGKTVSTNQNQSKNKDQLVLYTWEGTVPKEVLDGFEKETGIKVVYSNFDTDETMLEKLSQSKGKNYDVIIADDYIVEQAAKQDLVSEIDKSKVENVKNVDPRFQGFFYDKENKYTVPYAAGIPLIVYNPEKVKIDIKGYSDLWNPELKDKIAITGNYRVINGITLLSMGKSMNEEDISVINKAGEKLKNLAPNIRLIQDSNTQNALLNGEADVAFLYTSQVNQALNENPKLKVVYPKEGLGFGIMATFVPKDAPNKDAAYKFVNYLLKPDVYKKCIESIGYFSTNKEASKSVDKRYVLPNSAKDGEIIQNVSQEADKAYNQNWTEFKTATGQDK